jgi:hypothetical protein
MRTTLFALRRILSERRQLARREQQLLDQMIKSLPSVDQNGTRTAKALSRRKTIACPRCDRRFAMPMHLGRHMAMSHKRRRAA